MNFQLRESLLDSFERNSSLTSNGRNPSPDTRHFFVDPCKSYIKLSYILLCFINYVIYDKKNNHGQIDFASQISFDIILFHYT